MKFETVTVTQRKNIGNYEHIEITTTAKIEDGEDFVSVAMTARTYVDAILNMPLGTVEEKKEPVVADEPKVKKEKKSKKVKEEVATVEEETPKAEVVEEVREEPKVKAKSKATPYSADNKHILQSYLTQKYGEAWKSVKPRHEIVEFTSKLPGQDFLDEEGNILPTFLEHIHSFFGA